MLAAMKHEYVLMLMGSRSRLRLDVDIELGADVVADCYKFSDSGCCQSNTY